MGVMPRVKAGFDSSLDLIAKRLRDDGDNVTREALPTRWVDLILYLDEQERKTCARSQHAAPREQSLGETERAVTRQEKVLQELMRTEEPTEEATALLEHLRQKVARALAERH
jgi:hypothetical protein